MVVLSEKMEIAFYNVIDRRCDRAEAMGASNEEIREGISKYSEQFISNHEMSEYKQREIRVFVASILSLYKD